MNPPSAISSLFRPPQTGCRPHCGGGWGGASALLNPPTQIRISSGNIFTDMATRDQASHDPIKLTRHGVFSPSKWLK